MLMKIVDGAAVADHVAREAPTAAQDVGQQELAAAAGFAERAVVGAHHGLDPGADEFLEGRQVGIVEILGRGPGVETMSGLLGAAVHGVVLGAGGGLEIVRMVAL